METNVSNGTRCGAVRRRNQSFNSRTKNWTNRDEHGAFMY